MALSRIVGLAMIVALFAAVFIGCVLAAGFLDALVVFAAVAFMVGWIFVGASLINPIS